MGKTLLFNPISLVHDRKIDMLKQYLPDWNIRCIYNPRFSWFRNRGESGSRETFYFTDSYFQRIPKYVFDDIEVVILFTAQVRIPPCNLIQEATLRSIPVIAIEEVYQMMLEQGSVNNYFLPVDHLFVASDYERENFIKLGVPEDVAETTGCLPNYKDLNKNNSIRKDRLKKELSLSFNKSIVTLCLASVTPGGETLEVRKKLLTCVSLGLPDKYELLVKPHPHEKDKNFNDFVMRYAPNAKVTHPHIPFDEILDITDILLNRGNSQVVIEALQKGIPVAVIPFGRKTLFHGLLDEAIINEKRDLASVLNMLEKEGIIVYNEIFQKYLSITAEQAIKKIVFRISEIAEKKELYKPEKRLIELAVFWAWIGYAPQALSTLSKIYNKFCDSPLLEKIYRLVSYKANREDLTFLKEWSKDSYKEWILQSLWIKTLYVKGLKLDVRDRDWLADYPPRMNRPDFLIYATLLYWCYIKSGMHRESEILLNKLTTEFGHLKEIKALKLSSSNRNKSYYFNKSYWFNHFKYNAVLSVKNLLRGLETLGKQ